MSELFMKSPKQVLLLRVKNVFACIDLFYVNKIISLPQLKVVPGSPSYVVGLLNWAGNSILVIDLAFRLQLNRDQRYAIDTPILLCTENSQTTGILVDEIIGLHQVQEKMQMENKLGQKNSFFLGSLNVNSQIYLLLDINKIMHMDFYLEENSAQSLMDMVQKAHD